ncbi:MAG: ABC transporter ATP-binding protein [Anaerolineae bacterium]
MAEQLPILEVRGLTKHFKSGNAMRVKVVKALEDVSFKLYPGKVVALVGESGSGKSTTARLISKLYDPTAGEILYEGKNVASARTRKAMLEYRSHVQMIFQDPFGSLNPVHRVEYILKRPLMLHKKANRKNVDELVQTLLKRVSLTPADEFAEKYPHQLSGGQRQRVAIARALAVEPKVIIADEPVSMLDVSIRMGVLNLMAQLRDENNIAFLYVTHDLASARYFADETMVMYAGRVVESGPSEDLIRNPKHPYTQLLLSAVPDPSRGLRTQDIEVTGEVPSLGAVGQGCPFAPRCKHVMTKCQAAMPPVTDLGEGRKTRCYLYENGMAVQNGAQTVVSAAQVQA